MAKELQNTLILKTKLIFIWEHLANLLLALVDIWQHLLMLLITLIVFYGLGCLLAGTLNHFDKVNQERKQEEEKAEKIREQESEEKEEQK